MILTGNPQERAALARRKRRFDRLAEKWGPDRLAGRAARNLARKARAAIWESHEIEQRRYWGDSIYNAINGCASIEQPETQGTPANA